MISKHSFSQAILLFSLLFYTQSLWANIWVNEAYGKYRYPFYIGPMVGYGSTLWDGLVPPKSKQSVALMISAPSEAQEGGAVWGFYGGYEIIPYFAVEMNYMRFPNAKICYDEDSLFSFTHKFRTSFTTKTEKVALMGKFMFFIPKTDVRAFSSVGAAEIHRCDEIVDRWRLGPTFAVGVNYDFTPHIMGEFVIDYSSGYGVSELDPSADYIPFLIAGMFRVAYRF